MYNGLIIINKDPGFTSSDVVAKLRGILHMRKMGHTGTLDPDAVGVLPVCLGSGTKLVEMIGDTDKEYVAVMRLGVMTDTQDMSGTVLEEIPEETIRKTISEQQIIEAAAHFTGEIDQIPPMYSAVKIGGKKLYELARAGKTVERAARRITIHELEVMNVDLPLVTIRVCCSKGTYIRTLCEDMGKYLGTGAAMQHLTRTRVGSFRLDQAITLTRVEEIVHTDPARIEHFILPVDSFFSEAPPLHVKEEALLYLQNGNPLALRDTDCTRELAAKIKQENCLVRMYGSDGKFYAVYRYDHARRRLVNEKFFPEASQHA